MGYKDALESYKKGGHSPFGDIEKSLNAYSDTRKESDLAAIASGISQAESRMRAEGIDPSSIPLFQSLRSQVPGLPDPFSLASLKTGDPAKLMTTPKSNIIDTSMIAPATDISKGLTFPTPTTPYDISQLGGFGMTPQEAAGGPVGIKAYQDRTAKLYTPETDVYAKTQEETKVQSLSERLQSLNEELTGQSAFKAGQEVSQDVMGKQKTVNDLTAQIKTLQNEAAAIPLQQAGVNVTSAMLGAKQRELLMQNSIKALGLAAFLEAARGNLALANDLVDRAVAAKFDPIKEKIAALTANYNLIIASPSATLADKKRAQQLKDIETAKAAEVKKQETETENIYKIGLKAAENNADSLTLQRIQKAATAAEALEIAAEAGALKGKQDTSIVEVGGRKLLVDNQTGKTIKDLGSASEIGVDTELTSKQTAQAIQLANSLKAQPAYVDMIDIYTGIQGVETGLSQKNGFGDITAINAFQRMVDPGATVRSEDVVLLQSASAFVQKVLSDYPMEKLTKGSKLPDPVREQMLKVAHDLYETRANNYNQSVGQQYRKLSEGSGIDFGYIGTDFPATYGNLLDAPKTDEEKSAALDKMIMGTGVEIDVEKNPTGFFDSLLNMFGLQTKK